MSQNLPNTSCTVCLVQSEILDVVVGRGSVTKATNPEAKRVSDPDPFTLVGSGFLKTLGSISGFGLNNRIRIANPDPKYR